MIKTKSFSIALLLAAGLLTPHSASAGDPPIPAEAVEKAQTLIKASSKLGAGHAAEAKRRAGRTQAPPLDAGFEKFLTLKNLRSEKVPAGEDFDALVASFKRWESGEAPVRKVNGCLGPGDYCSSSVWCCGAMACRGGVCGGGGPSCIPRGRPCGGSIWCCGAAICNDRGYCQ